MLNTLLMSSIILLSSSFNPLHSSPDLTLVSVEPETKCHLIYLQEEVQELRCLTSLRLEDRQTKKSSNLPNVAVSSTILPQNSKDYSFLEILVDYQNLTELPEVYFIEQDIKGNIISTAQELSDVIVKGCLPIEDKEYLSRINCVVNPILN